MSDAYKRRDQLELRLAQPAPKKPLTSKPGIWYRGLLTREMAGGALKEGDSVYCKEAGDHEGWYRCITADKRAMFSAYKPAVLVEKCLDQMAIEKLWWE